MRYLVSRVFYFKWRMKFSVDRHRCMPADEQWTAVQARVAVQVPMAESLRWFWPGCWSLILRWNGKASENPSRLDLECFCWGRVNYTLSSKERTCVCVDLGSYLRACACMHASCMLCCCCFPSFFYFCDEYVYLYDIYIRACIRAWRKFLMRTAKKTIQTIANNSYASALPKWQISIQTLANSYVRLDLPKILPHLTCCK